jgi:hypothetical protein
VERSAVLPARNNNLPMTQDPANTWMPATAAQQAALFAARFATHGKPQISPLRSFGAPVEMTKGRVVVVLSKG